MLSLFLLFFAFFTCVLYPLRDFLHPQESADALQLILPLGCKGIVAMYRYWTYTGFYVMSELWSTAIMAVLFWGLANEITSVGEARRYYILWSIGANIAGIFSGMAAVYFSGGIFLSWFPYGNNAWEQSVCFLCCATILS